MTTGSSHASDRVISLPLPSSCGPPQYDRYCQDLPSRRMPVGRMRSTCTRMVIPGSVNCQHSRCSIAPGARSSKRSTAFNGNLSEAVSDPRIL